MAFSAPIAASAVLAAGCAEIIGADFDVRAAECAAPPCPVVLADQQDMPYGLAAADGYVYWTAKSSGPGEGKVMRVSRDGGEPQELAGGQGAPNRIVVRGGYVYWTDSTNPGAVRRIAADGSGGADDVATNQDTPIGIAVDDEHVYWASNDGTIQRVPLSLADTEPPFATGVPKPGLLAIDEFYVYWTEYTSEGRVQRGQKSDGAATPIAQDQLFPNGIAVAPEDVFFATADAIQAVDKSGAGPRILAPAQQRPAEVATDGAFVYWANYEGGTVMRASAGGDVLEVLASGQPSPNGVALDADYIYWATLVQGGRVFKLPKP
jgi:hypothetical protein